MNSAILYRRKTYAAKTPLGVVFFACPYGVKRQVVAWAVKRIVRSGYSVVVYDFSTKLLLGPDLSLLPRTVSQVAQDIRNLTEEYMAQGQSNFGIFGTSLGSFVMFGAIASNPKVSWGIFNTAGNAAHGAWSIPKVRKSLAKHGHSLKDLEKAWSGVQGPVFETSDSARHFLFIGSYRDEIVPLHTLEQYTTGMKSAGITTEVREYSKGKHIISAMRGLRYADRLILEIDRAR